MNKNQKLCLCILSSIAYILILGIGCTKKNGESQNITSFPRQETLYVSGFIWGPPSNFNPLSDDPSYPMTGDVNLVYESMFGYNLLTGELEGILGTEYILFDTILTVTLNENSKWHDGTPVTAEDVLFTFELHKRYPTNMHSHWEYISDVKSEGANTVHFVLNMKNYNPLTMREIIATTYILPKKVFEKIEQECIALANAEKKGKADADEVYVKICEYKNDKAPLGSGPYTLMTYSDQKVVLNRVDSYWGNILHNGTKIPAKYIVHPIFKSNDAGNLSLVQGQIDVSQNFMPQIWNKFKKGVGTWYKEKPYYVPGTIPCMLMPLTKAPYNDVNFRQAVACAINYDQILNLSIYGYAPKLLPGLIIPYGAEKRYYNEEDTKKYGVSYNPEKARTILKNAGYTWGPDSMLISPDGKKIEGLKVTCPSGWTDWEACVRIFVTSLRAIGIDVRERFTEEPVWWKDLLNGVFDFTMYSPLDYQSAAVPWNRFNRTMSSEQWAPIGEIMWTNQGRYKDAVADSLLRVIPKLKDEAEVLKTYRVLNVKFMKELPVIPLLYRPWFFYEFSIKHWTNFPTEENPHSPPQCLIVGAGIKGLWEIKPVGK